LGAVETLIVWENLEVNRITLRNNSTSEEKVIYLTPEQERSDSHFRDAATGSELETIDKVCLIFESANMNQ
jgi:peptide chain release factor subunit 1